jgi:hypothetical protein
MGDLVGFRGVALILLQNLRIRLGLLDVSHGGATANTALVAHASSILALNEGDLPYGLRLLCSGLVENVGRFTAGGQLSNSFTAHPKVCWAALPPATCHLPPAACHLPPATCHLPPATCHLPPQLLVAPCLLLADHVGVHAQSCSVSVQLPHTLPQPALPASHTTCAPGTHPLSLASCATLPQVDPETGILHFFRYSLTSKPYVHYGQMAPNGSVLKQLSVDVPDPIMMHDFAITRNHAVFLDCPLLFSPDRIVKEKDVPFKFDCKRGSRIGLLHFGAKVGGLMLAPWWVA